MNFALFLEMHARSTPQQVALVDARRRLSWAELDAAASRFAALLVAGGVGIGDRVASFLPNRAEMVVAFLGALKAGAVFLPINARLQAADLGRILDHARPKWLLTDAERAGLVGDTPAQVMVIDPEGADFFARLAAQPEGFRMIGRQSGDLANIVYTSGTTGMPKAVIHTHGVRVAIAGGMADCFRLSTRDCALVVSPMFHIAGLNVLCNALFAGCKTVILEKWDLGDFLTTLRDEGVTYMQMVSTILVDIANAPAALFVGLNSRVRFTWGGGHNVGDGVMQLYEQRVGGVFLQGWGRTEGGFSYNRLEGRRLDSHGVGNANASELMVYDHDSRGPAAPGHSGEIVVRGDGVSPGYWDGEYIRIKPALDGGWQRTGDMGWMDAEGHLHFGGRDDHMIKTGGENVYPAEVEEVVLALPGVADAVVLGIPDARLGQMIAAVVVAAEGGAQDPAQLVAACRGPLAAFKIPRRVVFVDSLPRLGSQKVDLAACRTLLLSHSKGGAVEPG